MPNGMTVPRQFMPPGRGHMHHDRGGESQFWGIRSQSLMEVALSASPELLQEGCRWVGWQRGPLGGRDQYARGSQHAGGALCAAAATAA